MKKNALIGIAVLFTIILAVSYFAAGSLNKLVKSAIEVYGSEATGTTVAVGGVEIKLDTGEGSIDDLQVGNVSGFADKNIFKLSNITVKLDTDTLMENPIVLKELAIRAPAVFYEINSDGVSNVDVLKKRLAAGGGGDDEPAGAGEPFKMVIKKLIVEGGSASVRIAALGGREQSVKLPTITLTDVGKKSGGATASEVAQLLSSELVKGTNKAVTSLGVDKYLGKSADMLKQGASGLGEAAGEAAGKAGGAIKGILGK